jgi:hypothetical protein
LKKNVEKDIAKWNKMIINDNNKRWVEVITDIKKICNSPYHKPPTHLCIPPGSKYVHVCPNCGEKFIMEQPLVVF